MGHPHRPTQPAPADRIDLAAALELVGDDATTVIIDLTEVDELDRDELELLARLQDRGSVRVVGARWPHVRATLLAAPLGEIARLAVLTRRLVTAAQP